jgi:hypothetical protein
MSPTKLPEQEQQEQKKVEQLSPLYQQILKNIPMMPDTAAIPVPVAALARRRIRTTCAAAVPARLHAAALGVSRERTAQRDSR